MKGRRGGDDLFKVRVGNSWMHLVQLFAPVFGFLQLVNCQFGHLAVCFVSATHLVTADSEMLTVLLDCSGETPLGIWNWRLFNHAWVYISVTGRIGKSKRVVTW